MRNWGDFKEWIEKHGIDDCTPIDTFSEEKKGSKFKMSIQLDLDEARIDVIKLISVKNSHTE